MGVSTNAYLIFGFHIGEIEETIMINGEEIDPDDLIIMYYGYEPGMDWKKCSKVEDDSPFELILHCSSEYPMYILGIKKTSARAYRGYPSELDPDVLKENTDEWVHLLKGFADHFGFECKPAWWLASYTD